MLSLSKALDLPLDGILERPAPRAVVLRILRQDYEADERQIFGDAARRSAISGLEVSAEIFVRSQDGRLDAPVYLRLLFVLGLGSGRLSSGEEPLVYLPSQHFNVW